MLPSKNPPRHGKFNYWGCWPGPRGQLVRKISTRSFVFWRNVALLYSADVDFVWKVNDIYGDGSLALKHRFVPPPKYEGFPLPNLCPANMQEQVPRPRWVPALLAWSEHTSKPVSSMMVARRPEVLQLLTDIWKTHSGAGNTHNSKWTILCWVLIMPENFKTSTVREPWSTYQGRWHLFHKRFWFDHCDWKMWRN